MKKYIIVEDIAPRSHKVTYYIAQLDTSFEYPRYTIIYKIRYVSEGIERLKTLNQEDYYVMNPKERTHKNC